MIDGEFPVAPATGVANFAYSALAACLAFLMVLAAPESARARNLRC
jgi:hypothetical protein